ncbi:RNA-binding (RRM/RBD/RNP motifs) family protein [Artemisia annua]|uniref:RNA-binding (RRM/RBD/RNP motifs) family protein n=1 Tax=Artemisia annua TaxID=35608 RepID=A0A2U1L9V6_ARTAN|nr:RNA-binding (RRM/RBD/RNP motifs) family protein [Artemisia annua]
MVFGLWSMIGRLTLAAAVNRRERNSRIHNKGSESIDKVVQLAYNDVRYKLLSLKLRPTKNSVEAAGRWQLGAFFKQFGEIRRIRIARNKKTGKSKHFGFLEFASPEVAKIGAETMHNYLLFEHLLQVQIIPPERVHPKLWKGVNRYYKPMDWVCIECKRLNKERTSEEHQKLINGILKREEKRKRKIEAAGIDYKCPEIFGSDVPAVLHRRRLDLKTSG